MMENLPRLHCTARLGSKPAGQSTPLIVVGAKSGGVHEPTRRSNVSVWLGAPARRMKMTFLAVFSRIASGFQETVCANISIGEAKYPATPVAAILKKTRRSM